MKRTLLVVLLTCTFAIPVADARAPRAHVWVSGTAPLVIRGSGFKAGESVRVVVVLEKARRHTTVAAAGGRFAARFRTAASGCSLREVIASGSKGTRASWKVPPESCANPPISID
jgi:hypothetical protein